MYIDLTAVLGLGNLGAENKLVEYSTFWIWKKSY